MRLPQNVSKKRLASGETAFYWSPATRDRKAGCKLPSVRLRLEELFGEDCKADKLNAELRAWRRGEEPTAAKPGTVRWWRDNYQKDPAYKALSETTKANSYDSALKQIVEYPLKGGKTFGDMALKAVRRRHAKAMYVALQEQDEDGKPIQLPKANAVMRVARVLFGFAVDEEARPDNPFKRIKLQSPPPRRISWTAGQVETFCDKAREMGRASIALATRIQFELCQRQSDVIAMPRTAYRDGGILVRQNKTGALVLVPLDEAPDLKSEIEAQLERNPDSTCLIVSETTGRPYKRHNFSRLFRKISDAAGLPGELQSRDQRRSGLTEGGNAGGTETELRSTSGHKTREILSVYVLPTGDQARSLMRKRRSHRTKKDQKSE